MESPILLAVPNVSEGREAATIAQIASAFTGGDGSASRASSRAQGSDRAAVRLLDVHSDGDHHRSVFTLAGGARDLADALLRGGRTVVERIDVVRRERGE